ncbi:MAG: aldo/keto reductase [Candidatus Cyclobacteriaceae bacterium M3_2C_046]
MNYGELGKSKLKVSSMGLGLAALGRPGYINLGHADDLEQDYEVEHMENHAFRVLDLAWEKGIRYFDAARSYGRAEEFLGNWLRSRQISPSEVTIGSKWGYTYTANWQIQAEKHEVKAHTLEVLKRQWQETSQNLGEYLDLYQIHSATLESKVLENKAVLDELISLKASGVKIGLTLSGENQWQTLEKALHVFADGQLLFDTVQATWNVLEQSVGPALQQAKQAGMGIIIKEALANGRLTGKNVNELSHDKFKLIRDLALRAGLDLDAVALSIVLQQPWVDVVLSGAARNQHLQDNLKAFQVEMDEFSGKQVMEALKESPQIYWQIRSDLPWN